MSNSVRGILVSICPFACGYYLSYVFRTINAVIASTISGELALGPASLGILTAVYFLTFAAAQLPIGVMLDRYGPRRVQSVLMLVAAAGATIFALGHSFVWLVLGRALIGVGVAGALMAGLKAIVMWLPRERVPFANGWFIMFGALGAVTATEPADAMLKWTGWRMEFLALAAASATVGIAMLRLSREPDPLEPAPVARTAGLRTIYADERFQRLAPLSAVCIGTAWAMQGLWAAPWMSDVQRLDRSAIVFRLFVMGLALCAGALFLGGIADRLRRHGVPVRLLLGAVAVLLLIAETMLVGRLPVPSLLPWSSIGLVGAATVISYAALAEYFPKEIAGRANAALNVLHIGAAFGIQSLIGIIIERWPADPFGRYPVIAYQSAFATLGVLLLIAIVWFVWPVRVEGVGVFAARPD